MTLSGCTTPSVKGKPQPERAIGLPQVYAEGCAPYEPKLAPGNPKKNANKLAASFSQCSGLQRDTYVYSQCFILDLQGAELPSYCLTGAHKAR